MSQPREPDDRSGFDIGILCALPVESKAVSAVFDGYWRDYGKAPGDDNSYVTGWVCKHNVVLAYMPHMGKAAASSAAANLKNSFPRLRLCLVVGICGGVPTTTESGSVHLGDILLSTDLKEIDFGRMYPDGLRMKDNHEGNLGRQPPEIRAFIHKLRASIGPRQLIDQTLTYFQDLCQLKEFHIQTICPEEDRLYASAYRHKHQDSRDCSICAACELPNDPVCPLAIESDCVELGCDNFEHRRNPLAEQGPNVVPKPQIHFGSLASADVVMKSGQHRDQIAEQQHVIGFEMEGAGVWNRLPTIVVKGVCDYADSHKNKRWQGYAAITAAACMKAVLNHWSPQDYNEGLETQNTQAVRKTQEALLRSLAFPEMFMRRNKTEDAAAGTFKWLYTHSSYTTWLREHGRLLWIKGKPGSGKSTLLNFAVQKAEEGKCILASFFCDGNGVKLQKNQEGIFRSLLHQILSQAPESLRPFTKKFDDYQRTRGEAGKDWFWEAKELRNMLRQVTLQSQVSTRIEIFVDALDECGEEIAIDLASFFDQLTARQPNGLVNPSVCFSCRHFPNIRISHADDLTICMENENYNDIDQYVHQRMRDAFLDEDESSDISRMICDNASGVFQWVIIVIKQIVRLRMYRKSLKFIRREIQETPKDLHDLYENIMRAISPEDAPNTLKLMQWICFAMRPLSEGEIRVALALDIQPQYSTFAEMNDSVDFIAEEDVEEEVKRLSCGLAEIQVYEGRRVARLIHQSVLDYLVKDGLRKLSRNPSNNAIAEAQFQLSRSCITCWTLQDAEQVAVEHWKSHESNRNWQEEKFRIHKRKLPKVFSNPSSQSKLLAYAVENWLPHAQEAEKLGLSQDDLLLRLQFPSRNLIKRWSKLLCFTNDVPLYGVDRRLTLLHVASMHGLLSLVQTIYSSDPSYDMNVIDLYGETPLLQATVRNHDAVVGFLLDICKVDPNTKDTLGLSPLSRAVAMRHEQILSRLLRSRAIEIDLRNSSCFTNLSHAARNGHYAEVAELLGRSHVEVDMMDHFGTTPLMFAVSLGNICMVQLLLSTHRVDVNRTNRNGRTALSLAAEGNLYSIVEDLLKQPEIELDIADSDGWTPLMYAAMINSFNIVRLLLDTHRIDINRKNRKGQTALDLSKKYVRLGSVTTTMLETYSELQAEEKTLDTQ